jgi:hypothetical protein
MGKSFIDSVSGKVRIFTHKEEVMDYHQPVIDLIKQRFSCRTYNESPIEAEQRQKLVEYLSTLRTGPLGTATRFELAATTEGDSVALKNLGTYGFIKGATGFIIGAMGVGDKNLEDFGYQMERAILYATDLNLGTCWLGGSFTKSQFAKKIAVMNGETVPAVTAIGSMAEGARDGRLRRKMGGAQRAPWAHLFFDSRFDRPLSPEAAGEYSEPLAMVRLAPSASNKQPWRIIRENKSWHFYLQRSPGYPPVLYKRLLGMADIQRIDTGIAMCHFELTTASLGLRGQWVVTPPRMAVTDPLMEYAVSWKQP